ncbi:hypothetical protein COV04_03225 [Candidatus Uhrbacteria bacterium CG10_big_fil_rev_8_21_14_0_10_48_11]|uniref:Uncharacterized protein n=1 Tax=Candidatus Uhrbacteria bacterium CG10_big_fil_rev_8_21_14_0_10_48_11 TaxID=1975037 RepID=A0A2M8LE65_9BACT|nr:MAG: hypothetical protein COV04_03225 [Candidatus Uhrbacteria bacterium CG10_big_fil_rev_8_21_14_0_10_48_11]
MEKEVGEQGEKNSQKTREMNFADALGLDLSTPGGKKLYDEAMRLMEEEAPETAAARVAREKRGPLKEKLPPISPEANEGKPERVYTWDAGGREQHRTALLDFAKKNGIDVDVETEGWEKRVEDAIAKLTG